MTTAPVAAAGDGQRARRVAAFYGGVVPVTDERTVAFEVGRSLGRSGFTVRHGGYNGLMEEVAAGASEAGGDVVAVTLDGVDWGPFNPYVTDVLRLPDFGARMTCFLDEADLVVGMGGGVGTLHEITAAIWYAGNVRAVPVWLVGPTALRLLAFLREEGWLFESPTRPLDFLGAMQGNAEFTDSLAQLAAGRGRQGQWS